MQAQKCARLIFTPPPEERNIPRDVILQVLISHYGIFDSESIFYESYQPISTKDIGIKQAAFNPCLMRKNADRKITGTVGLVTDNILNTSTPYFLRLETEATDRFEIKVKK